MDVVVAGLRRSTFDIILVANVELLQGKQARYRTRSRDSFAMP